VGDLSNNYLFLTVLEFRRSKIKVPGEGPLPSPGGLQKATLLLCLHMVKREIISLLSLLINRIIISLMKVLLS
jgi:hypothetical protein